MTLRSAIAALMLAACVAPASARIMVVRASDQFTQSGNSVKLNEKEAQVERQNQAIIETMNLWGVDYKLFQLSSVNTEMLRTGLVYYKKDITTSKYGYDTSGPSEQFAGVVVLGGRTSYTGYLAGERFNPNLPAEYNGCDPCSLTVGGINKWPIRPVLFMFGALSGFPNDAEANEWADNASFPANACSSGTKLRNPEGIPRTLKSKGSGLAFMSSANMSGYIANPTPPAGGFRGHLTTNTPHSFSFYLNSRIQANNADTLFAGSDSLVIWERPFTGLYAGANNTTPIRPIIWANVMGASPCYDSSVAISSTYNRPCEYAEEVVLMALARLDSLTSGGVFTKKRTAAIVISGGFERTLRRLPGGANNADSSVVKASIDSLAAYGIPVTVTVNVDSVASYPNEVAWWTNKGLRVRFAPVTTYGVSDTTALTASANWSVTRPVDVFGRYRTRAFYGDSAAIHSYTSGGSDSSIYQGLRYLRSKATSLGLTPLSGTVIAPLDDWSPKNMLSKNNALDSLTRVFRLAGYSAALTDVQRPEADIIRITTAGGGKDRVRGWYGKQFVYRNRLSGEDFNFVGHTGYNISGGSKMFFYTLDTTSTPLTYSFGGGGPTAATASMQAIGRFWAGFAHQTWRDPDWFPIDGVSFMAGYLDVVIPSTDLFNDFRRSSVLKMHVSDFSGIPNGPPTRPGWWAVKSLNNAFRSINAMAWKPVVSLGFPEDIEP